MKVRIEVGGGFLQITASDGDVSVCSSIPTSEVSKLEIIELGKELNDRIELCIATLEEKLK